MIDKGLKSQIRSLIQDPRWQAIETALKIYKEDNFLDLTHKRENEFETIWYIAHGEGGKHHLNAFMKQLEKYASYD